MARALKCPAEDLHNESLLEARIGLRRSETPFARVVAKAAALRWTRDPFDRLIAGHALADEVDLLTADQALHKHFKRARWA